MNREREMDEFLNYFKNLFMQNPNLQINEKIFYNKLSEYGLTNEEINKKRQFDINPNIKNNMFPSWINNFKNNPNLQVFFTERQNRFLQFYNNKSDSSECYKLYLSFPEDKLYDCVNLIFQFIANNKMETFSKVADTIRSDSVVLRIVTKEDTLKVLNFINSNPYISSACKRTNPFLIRYGNVGLGYDRWMSYNSVLSFMLKRYFTSKKLENNFYNVSIKDFKNYLINSYNKIFYNKTSLENFKKDEYIKSEINRCNESLRMTSEETLSNVKDIINLLIIATDTKQMTQEYFKTVEEMMDSSHNAKNCELINNTLELSPFDIFTRAYHATLKNHSLNQLYAALKYGLQGNYSFFSNDGNNLYRERLTKISPDDYKKYAIPAIQKIEYDAYVAFNNACNATLKNHSLNQLYTALKLGLEGNYSAFSNDGENLYRKKLIEKCPQILYQTFAKELIEKLDKERKKINSDKKR